MSRPWKSFAIAVVGIVVLWPAVVWAHAQLRKSEPAASSTLLVAPSEIRLWFSEAPELAMTRLSLKDSAGAAIELGTVERGDSKLSLRARVTGAMAPGRYTITWSTAASDGHPSSGSFKFVLLPSATPAAIPTTPPMAPVPADTAAATMKGIRDAGALTPAYIAARAVGFIGLLAVIGAVVFRVTVLARVPEVSVAVREAMSARAATLGLYAALATLGAGLLRLWLQWKMLNGDPAAVAIHLGTMTMDTQWGAAWILQFAAALFAAVALFVARRGHRHSWTLAGLGAAVLVVSPALGGHAAASPHWAGMAIFLDSLHVLGAAGWLGTLLCVVAIGIPVALATATEEAWAVVATLVNAFSPGALGFAALVVITGVLSAWMRLGGFSPLWTSTYGKVLMVKLALLLGVVGSGAYNWLRVRPTLGTAVASTHVRRTATVELAIGFFVIVVTAILVAVPTP